MKYSTEKDIIRYPAAGVETLRPPQVVSGIGFLYYDLGNGLYVWRTPDQLNEVGQRGAGGTYYAKTGAHILEASFIRLHDAMRAVVATLQDYVDGHAVRVSHPRAAARVAASGSWWRPRL